MIIVLCVLVFVIVYKLCLKELDGDFACPKTIKTVENILFFGVYVYYITFDDPSTEKKIIAISESKLSRGDAISRRWIAKNIYFVKN